MDPRGGPGGAAFAWPGDHPELTAGNGFHRRCQRPGPVPAPAWIRPACVREWALHHLRERDPSVLEPAGPPARNSPSHEAGLTDRPQLPQR